jgi:hypothetical protein
LILLTGKMMDADAKLIAQYQPQLVRLGAHKVAHLDMSH